MKALVLRGPNTRFELTEVPDPVAGAGEAVARVIAVEVARDKFDACRKAGADEVVDASACEAAEALLDLTHGRGVDVALVARGEVWPLVSDIRPLEEAEALHERVERGEVTGRAALLIG